MEAAQLRITAFVTIMAKSDKMTVGLDESVILERQYKNIYVTKIYASLSSFFFLCPVNDLSYRILSGFGMYYRKNISIPIFRLRCAVDHASDYEEILLSTPALATDFF